ncbi:uncharacterized protein LOC133037004 [Cannabis sativa]|uniref:uncharacterized protein LOC133037004 n=1 Tax=Cannabis sativa TaxID=3483 RepID=UPI0029C9B482|nr:uncharacterized protein LOC133037004 [Cannabis sativa]
MAVAWNPNTFSINIIKCTSQLIHLQVSTLDGMSFLVTFVYAFSDEEGRMILWQDLKAISTQDPWVVMGDFNDVLEQEERIGSRVKTLTSHSFKDCVSQCQLEDIKSSGKFFTWCNNQQEDDRIYSKLDRVMANCKWMETYPGAEAIFLNEGAFDHSSALVIFHHLAVNGRKPFSYFKMWISHPEYSSRLQHIWQQKVSGTKMYQVVAKLKALKPAFKKINQEGYNDLQSTVIKAVSVLDNCQNQLSLDPLNQELQQKESAA